MARSGLSTASASAWRQSVQPHAWEEQRKEVNIGYCQQLQTCNCLGACLQGSFKAVFPTLLHLQARKLENALDVKLGQFAKLCAGYEQSYSRGESGLATDQVGGVQRLCFKVSNAQTALPGKKAV